MNQNKSMTAQQGRRGSSRTRVSAPIWHKLPIGMREPFERLWQEAQPQLGVFSIPMANRCGVSRFVLNHHVKTGNLLRLARGVYRFADAPMDTPSEVVAVAATIAGPEAVASHETALTLYDLSDVIPSFYEFTLPATRRSRNLGRNYKVHTRKRPFAEDDVRIVHGVRATSPARSIVDSANEGTGPEQIVMAVWQSLNRRIATPSEFDQALKRSPARVKELVSHAIAEFQSGRYDRELAR